MAKKGQTFPFRVIFRYPNGIGDTIVATSQEDVVAKAAQLLYRGADVDIARVDPATRKPVVVLKITADEVGFDRDLGPTDIAHIDTLKAWIRPDAAPAPAPQKEEPPVQPTDQTTPATAPFNKSTRLALNALIGERATRIVADQDRLAKLPANSQSSKAQTYRNRIASAHTVIADLQRLIQIIDDVNAGKD